jgi:hypothetical protein
MAYFIFLKYFDSLEDFRINPHVKIPPRSPPTNFQSFDIFKNQIVIQKRFFPHFLPNRPSGQPAHPAFWPSRGPFFFLFNWPSPPLSPLGLGLSAGPADHASVVPCPIAASLTGKCFTSHRLLPSLCLADRWTPPIITLLRHRLSSTPRRCLVEPPWLLRPPPHPLSLWPTVTTP